MSKIRQMFVLLLLLACAAFAQEGPIKKNATEIAVWGGGGSGIGASDATQMANVGLRLGRVLTGGHGPGFLRGNLEYAFDAVPLYLFFQDQPVATSNGIVQRRQTVYAASVSPVIVKWNFSSGKRVVPFIGAEGSAIFATRNVPGGDTSHVNFASGIASGLQFLRGEHHSLSLSGHLMHISNASIGNHNPGVNVALQMRMGYQWWK